MGVNVNERQLNALIKGMNRIASEMEDWEKPIRDSVDILDKEAQQNFEQQGRLYAKRGSWQPLKASTRLQRQRRGFGGARPILVQTGELKGSFKKGPFKKKSGIFKNTDKKAIFHQEGTRKMPKREIIGITEKFKKATGLVFANYIKKMLNKHFNG